MTQKESISNREWAERMSKFIGIKNYTPMTLEEVATVLGCTRERVRQIEVMAIKKFRKKLEKRGITNFRDVSAETHYSSGSGYTGLKDTYKEG